MEIVYKNEAIKNLKILTSSDKQKAKKKIESLQGSPLEGKKLKGEFSGLRSIRAWPLRIIYSFDPRAKIITIITVDFRGNVYK